MKIRLAVWDSNLIIALSLAIEAREKIEREKGYTSDSALLAGWKQMREALYRGDNVEIVRY